MTESNLLYILFKIQIQTHSCTVICMNHRFHSISPPNISLHEIDIIPKEGLKKNNVFQLVQMDWQRNGNDWEPCEISFQMFWASANGSSTNIIIRTSKGTEYTRAFVLTSQWQQMMLAFDFSHSRNIHNYLWHEVDLKLSA